MNRCVLPVIAAVMSLVATSQSMGAKATTAVTVVSYRCEEGPLAITYAKKASGEESVFVDLADRMVRMWRLTDRAEEVFVSTHGDAGSYRWRIDDELGALTWLGPEADAEEKVLFGNCRATSVK